MEDTLLETAVNRLLETGDRLLETVVNRLLETVVNRLLETVEQTVAVCSNLSKPEQLKVHLHYDSEVSLSTFLGSLVVLLKGLSLSVM